MLKNKFLKQIFILALSCYSAVAMSANVYVSQSDISSYGIYLKGEQGYVKVTSFSSPTRVIDQKDYYKLPYAVRTNEEIELLIFLKDFKAKDFGFEFRPMSIVASNEEVQFEFSPIPGKEDMYKATYAQPVASSTLLLVYNFGLFQHAVGVIALGDIESELVRVFSDMRQPAYAALPELEGVVSKFPNNAKLNELLGQWRKVAKKEKDDADYQYVQKAWEEYKGTQKITLQERYLNKVLREINGYLNTHPNGEHAIEAKERKVAAEKRLAEIERIL